MLSITRHRVQSDGLDAFLDSARTAAQVLSERPGFRWVSVARAVDDPDLVVIASEWDDIGSYRRALSAFEVKTRAVPLLSTAVDEATAFEVLHRRAPEGVVDADTAVVTGEWALGRPSEPRG